MTGPLTQPGKGARTRGEGTKRDDHGGKDAHGQDAMPRHRARTRARESGGGRDGRGTAMDERDASSSTGSSGAPGAPGAPGVSGTSGPSGVEPLPDLLELDLAELRTLDHPVLDEVLADLRERAGRPSEMLWGFQNSI